MLTSDQIEEWDIAALREIDGSVEPDPARPYIICPMGTGTRDRAVMFKGDGARIVVVVRTRAHGEITRKAGYQWADLRKPFKEQPMRCVVTMHGLPKLGHPVEGSYLIASDWGMIADGKTRVYKYFRNANRTRRFCIASGPPHPWAAYAVMKALGNADKGLRNVTEYHKTLHLRSGPGMQQWLTEPNWEAVQAISEQFQQFIDKRAPL
jgi:hypothetical protein